MQIDSYQHRHKLVLTALLLALFAVPFAVEWQNLKQHDTNAFMAGGTVIGRPAVTTSTPDTPASNNSSAMAAIAGKTLLGTLAQ